MHNELTEVAIPLPNNWSQSVRNSLLNVIGLVRICILAGREFLLTKVLTSTAHTQRLDTEEALLHKELRYLDYKRISPSIDSPCAKPQVEVQGNSGDPIVLKSTVLQVVVICR
ncbi:MAG: hypothetical protein COB36_12225 [Alphaproteobacteria bacterium]|nr:MAG: hypothetical protein COB36_12225 [Alphaproteobacteria bacterium]